MLDPNNLRVYSQAKELTCLVYEATNKFPSRETYGIVQQFRNAIVSVGANIAEGCGKNSKAELLRFFTISLGSLSESKYFLEISKDLGYLTKDEFSKLYPLAISLSKQITSFIQNLKIPSSPCLVD